MREDDIYVCICVYIIIYPLSRGLTEKLTGPKLLKKFLAFYGT
jgi:hypothetical protein